MAENLVERAEKSAHLGALFLGQFDKLGFGCIQKFKIWVWEPSAISFRPILTPRLLEKRAAFLKNTSPVIFLAAFRGRSWNERFYHHRGVQRRVHSAL